MRARCFALPVTAVLAACAAPHPYGNLHRVSRDGCVRFERARTAWVEWHVQPYSAARPSAAAVPVAPEAAGRAVAELTAAIANDPGNPLFLQQRGDLEAWLGDDNAAECDYRAAIAICEDWVPGYLGLAVVAIRRQDLAFAGEALDHAICSLLSIEHAGERGLPNPLRLLGLWVELPEYRDPLDPTTDRVDGLQLLMQWLYEHLQWRVDNDALAKGHPGTAGQAASVMRMLRARTALVRLAVEIPDPTAEPAKYLTRLDHEVLAHDPDCVEARFQKAAQLYQLHNLDAAEAVLRPYWQTDNPMLQAHQGLAALTGQVLAERWVGAPAAERPEHVAEFFRQLVAVHGGYRDGVFRLAQELVLAETDHDRARLEATAAAAAAMKVEDARAEELLAAVRSAARRALQPVVGS